MSKGVSEVAQQVFAAKPGNWSWTPDSHGRGQHRLQSSSDLQRSALCQSVWQVLGEEAADV